MPNETLELLKKALRIENALHSYGNDVKYAEAYEEMINGVCEQILDYDKNPYERDLSDLVKDISNSNCGLPFAVKKIWDIGDGWAEADQIGVMLDIVEVAKAYKIKSKCGKDVDAYLAYCIWKAYSDGLSANWLMGSVSNNEGGCSFVKHWIDEGVRWME